MNLPKTFDPGSFTMSSAAIEHFKNSRSLEKGDMGIRFSVEEASGCSGYNYAMDFVENHADEDFVFTWRMAGFTSTGRRVASLRIVC